ncbi:MAG: N-acetylmuramic acid 6-phosphate etherase [Candidatus Kapabacteria bacterium]|nr:N-acetylmuramic acid 6-phosphate etherase [Candidatus Kapabacteria bacterium]
MPETELFKEISSLQTEKRNPKSENIDKSSTIDILKVINNEDKLVPEAVSKVIPKIAEAVDILVEAFKKGGRLFYFGAGTSGRLGILDAAECPPTFGTDPEMVQGIIAGGKEAVFVAQEGAEDKPENAYLYFIERKINPNDVICGIAASGRTPFVKAAIEKGKEIGCRTIFICTVSQEKAIELGVSPDVLISCEVGPEVITGSTRMKSGTAQKLILNMISTAAMVKLGKTFGNIMVDLKITNNKLRERAKRILMEITGVSHDEAVEYLNKSQGNVKIALVMILGKVDYNKAKKILDESDGFVRVAIEKILAVNS